MPEKPVVHSVKTIAQTRLFHIEAVELEFSNGERRQYERINNDVAGSVTVIPVTDESVILIREYAVGSDAYELGFVKGLIDPGETPVEAGNRELKEEIGYGSRHIRQIRKTRVTPHYTTAIAYILLAEDLYAERCKGDEPEDLEQVHWPLSDINSLLEHQDINDVRTLHALYWLRDYLSEDRK